MPSSRKRLLSVLLDSAASARAWRQRAGPALVRRGEEIETAAGHVGNLGGAPRALVEFRSGGAAVDVGPDQLGVAARAIVLAGHLLNSFVRNSESRRERLFSRDTNKNANKPDGCVNFYACFQCATKIFLKIWNQTSSLSYCYYLCFQSGAPGRQLPSSITN